MALSRRIAPEDVDDYHLELAFDNLLHCRHRIRRDEGNAMINEDEIKFAIIKEPPNPWARISEVAAKVGVKPCEEGPPRQATMRARGADDKDYDIWEVIIAVLNKLDSTSNGTEASGAKPL